MKKIYLQPEMELTECVMLRAAVCSGGDLAPTNDQTQNPGGGTGLFGGGAPARKVF